MDITTFSIKNYQFTIIVSIMLFVLGGFSFLMAPQSEDPMIDVPRIVVNIVYLGATSLDLESQIGEPLGKAILELEDLKEFTSSFANGVATFVISFKHESDPEDKYQEVLHQLNRIRGTLPDEIYDIKVRKASTKTVPIIQYALFSASSSYANMEEEGEVFGEIIRKIDGVKSVKYNALPRQELQIQLDPVRMAQLHISIAQIEQVLKGSNSIIPGGTLRQSDRVFNVQTSGGYETIGEIRNTPIKNVGNQVILLQDVATVFFGYEDQQWRASFNGKPCVLMDIFMKSDYKIFDITQAIKDKKESYDLIHKDIEIVPIFDQSQSVEKRINGFLINLCQAVVLVIIIIYLLIGFRSALFVGIAIPLSIMASFWGLSFWNVGLHQISIAGFIVSLGLLVDNSIVIIENINRRIDLFGDSRLTAAIVGTKELIIPIGSATLTTIFAFVPLLAIPGSTGDFIWALPMTVIFTLTASFIIAVTVIPCLASMFLNPNQAGKKTFLGEKLHELNRDVYGKLLATVMNYRITNLVLVLLIFLVALYIIPLVGISFFPKAEKPFFRVGVTIPKGNNLAALERDLDQVELALGEFEEVKNIVRNTGHGHPKIYYNSGAPNYAENYGEFFVILQEYDPYGFYPFLDRLRDRLKEFKGIDIRVKEFVQGPPSEAPVVVKIFGDNLKKLQAYAGKITQILEDNGKVININNSMYGENVNMNLVVDHVKAASLGVSKLAINKTVQTYLMGRKIMTFTDFAKKDYDVVLRLGDVGKFTVSDFDEIFVQSNTGHFIPLRQLAKLEYIQVQEEINHLDAKRVASISGENIKGVSLGDLIGELRVDMDTLNWGNGYSYEFKGDVEKQKSSFQDLGFAAFIALFLILAILVIQFKSIKQTLIVFVALPLAIIGSVFILLFVGVSFSFTAFIGMTSLIGIAINNSIILVDAANRLMEEGKHKEEAIKMAANSRFTPILLTTTTTILGLLPITLSGSQLWSPMGYAIIGGLITSTVFILLTVPVLFDLLTRDTVANDR